MIDFLFIIGWIVMLLGLGVLLYPPKRRRRTNPGARR